MPIPAPKKNENKKKFLPRCMGDSVMVKDFKDIKKRFAVCINIWENKNKK